jgi:hypothetical protein
MYVLILQSTTTNESKRSIENIKNQWNYQKIA